MLLYPEIEPYEPDLRHRADEHAASRRALALPRGRTVLPRGVVPVSRRHTQSRPRQTDGPGRCLRPAAQRRSQPCRTGPGQFDDIREACRR